MLVNKLEGLNQTNPGSQRPVNKFIEKHTFFEKLLFNH